MKSGLKMHYKLKALQKSKKWKLLHRQIKSTSPITKEELGTNEKKYVSHEGYL